MLTRHTACIKDVRNQYMFSVRNRKERDHSENYARCMDNMKMGIEDVRVGWKCIGLIFLRTRTSCGFM
jgi:hypothetical protein